MAAWHRAWQVVGTAVFALSVAAEGRAAAVTPAGGCRPSTSTAGPGEASCASPPSTCQPDWCQDDGCALREAVAWLLAVGLRSAEGVDGGPPTATAESGAWRPEAAPLREGTRTPTADGDRDSEPVECITGMRPSGEWTPVSCHPGRTAPLPEGPLVHVVHTHPGGSSLSMADLWVLASRADVQSVSAVTADGRVFLAERGPRFRDLGRAYPPLLARVNDDVRRRAGDSRGGLRDVHADVNRALAARGVIRYREARLQMATQP